MNIQFLDVNSVWLVHRTLFVLNPYALRNSIEAQHLSAHAPWFLLRRIHGIRPDLALIVCKAIMVATRTTSLASSTIQVREGK